MASISLLRELAKCAVPAPAALLLHQGFTLSLSQSIAA